MCGIEFLDNKYKDLAGSKPVERAALARKRAGEKAPDQRIDRLESYLERILSSMSDQRSFEMLKRKMLDQYTTAMSDVPERFWVARGLGRDVAEHELEAKRHKVFNVEIADQRASLEQWIDYLHVGTEKGFPVGIAYWVMRSIVGSQEYELSERRFPKRSRGTLRRFPELYHAALDIVVRAASVHNYDEGFVFTGATEFVSKSEKEQFRRLLNKSDFLGMYLWANKLVNPVFRQEWHTSEGEWVSFPQGSDPVHMAERVRGRGCVWCISGIEKAREYLEKGDVKIFFSKNESGDAVVPRLAIVTEQGRVTEVRGVSYDQNIDPVMNDTLKSALSASGTDNKSVMQTMDDVVRLTRICDRAGRGEQMDQDDLRFLYQIDRPIRYFGDSPDARMRDAMMKRTAREDMPMVLGCEPRQIARSPSEMEQDGVKTYEGPLFERMFERMPRSLEHVYISFPANRIKLSTLECGGISREEAKSRCLEAGVVFPQGDPLDAVSFSGSVYHADLVLLTCKQMGIVPNASGGVSYESLCEKMRFLGLEPVPLETIVPLRLAHMNQSVGNFIIVGLGEESCDATSGAMLAYHNIDGYSIRQGGYGALGITSDMALVFRRSIR